MTTELLMMLLGGYLIVLVFACTRDGDRLGANHVTRWLGKHSFSLYVVHEHIVVTVAYIFYGTTNAVLVLVLAVPLSLAVAELFGSIIEVPAHRFARAVGQRFR